MNNLKEFSTYLIRFCNSDTIFSITILISTEKAYFIRWNLGRDSNNTWELKTVMDKRYSLLENITEKFNTKLNDDSESFIELRSCPICNGIGTVPDSSSTLGYIKCPCCYGSKCIEYKISKKI